jgi:hypothetical protein
MATTKKKIAEQVQRLLKGNPIISARIHINDIKLLVEQVSNQLLKADHFSVNMPEGDTIPNNAMIFTYDNIPVSTYKTTKSKCTLPSIPISLPRNVGVLHVSKIDAIDEPFVPIPSSLYGIVKPQSLLGDLSGLIGYEVVGKDIIFTKNLPGLSINYVFIRLVGVDLSQLTDYDLLPLSSDMEAQVIQTVYNILVQTPPADKAQTISD